MAIIRGTSGRDTLVGTDLYDTINGGADDDTIDGGAGNDKMAGGTGNDKFFGGDGADAMDGGADVDTVTYEGSTEGVKVNLATGRGLGGQAEGDTLISIENVTGSQYRDILAGSGDDNTIHGGRGDDTISAGGGDDTVIGGLGDDFLTGGAGSDTFVFVSAPYGNQNGVDEIADFQVGVDVLKFQSRTVWGGSAESLDDLTFSQAGDDTVISYGHTGKSIILLGVDLAQLQAHASTDFLFS